LQRTDGGRRRWQIASTIPQRAERLMGRALLRRRHAGSNYGRRRRAGRRALSVSRLLSLPPPYTVYLFLPGRFFSLCISTCYLFILLLYVYILATASC